MVRELMDEVMLQIFEYDVQAGSRLSSKVPPALTGISENEILEEYPNIPLIIILTHE